MSGEQREMTLDEILYDLPDSHRAKRELAALRQRPQEEWPEELDYQIKLVTCPDCQGNLVWSHRQSGAYCPDCMHTELAKYHDAERQAPEERPAYPYITDEHQSEPVGTWPEGVQRAFVEGAQWWQFTAHGATAFPSERDFMEAEAVKRYGAPATREEPRVAHSQSEYKRLKTLGADVLPPTERTALERTCEWTEDDDGVWHTGCGNAHQFNDGTPAQNGQRFCGYCGSKLVPVAGAQARQETE
jgi:hypothetical protein